MTYFIMQNIQDLNFYCNSYLVVFLDVLCTFLFYELCPVFWCVCSLSLSLSLSPESGGHKTMQCFFKYDRKKRGYHISLVFLLTTPTPPPPPPIPASKTKSYGFKRRAHSSRLNNKYNKGFPIPSLCTSLQEEGEAGGGGGQQKSG